MLTRGWLTNSTTDFAEAAKISTEIIANKATYGLDLWQDFGDAYVPANDNGKETMFTSDHTNDAKYGYYVVGAVRLVEQRLILLPGLLTGIILQ